MSKTTEERYPNRNEDTPAPNGPRQPESLPRQQSPIGRST